MSRSAAAAAALASAALASAAWLVIAAPAAQGPGVYTPEVRRALDSIRPAALEAHLRFLASDRLEGRGTGTRGYDLAARYVAEQLERLHLEPAGDAGSWHQTVPLRRATLVPAGCGVTLIRAGRERELAWERDFLMPADAYRLESEVTAGVVFAGHGVTAPELGYDDFGGIDARGKIVAVLTGAPARFPHTLRAHYSNGRVKDANLAAHGAIGVISIRTPTDERRTSWERSVRAQRFPAMRWLDARGVPDGAAPELQCAVTLHPAAAESLFAGAPRTLAQVFADDDSARLSSFDLPLQVHMRRTSRHEPAPSPNVVGLLRGTERGAAAEVVVLSAHLDHLGIGEPVEGDSIYNGACDNATGIAALLELAAAFAAAPQRPRRSLLFLAVTGEEKGLEGSSYFAQHPTVARERLVADLNLDMLVMAEPLRAIVAHGAEHSTLGAVANLAAARLGLKVMEDPVPEEVIFVRSDQYSFVRQGVPSLYVTGSAGEEGRAATIRWLRTIYHTPQDDLNQRLDPESLARFTRLHYLMAHLVANQAERPRWNRGDFFGERFGSK